MIGLRSITTILCAALLGWTTGCGSGPQSTTAPTAARAEGVYAFWPPSPDEPRIQFAKSFLSRDDVSKREASGLERLVFGSEVENSETINKPYGVAMRFGRIYVCDIRNSSLTVLDLKAKQTRLVGVSGNVTLKHPVAVAVGDDGQIYVADNSHGAILVFDASERFSRAIGHEKFKPAGVAVFGNRVYATDMTSQSVEAFDTATGQRLAAFGTVGDGDGQFRLPLGVATDSKGDVYVADMMRCRVQKFSPDGKFLMGFGEMGDFAGAFVRPKHLAVDSDGVIYVVDAGFQNVQMFNASGKLLMHFGAAGGHPGSMYLPAGIAVSDDAPDMVEGLTHPGFKTKRTIVVTNQFGLNRVALYAMGGLREGFTAADLAKSATAISTGVAVPTAEQLKFSNPGTETPIDPDAIKARSAPSGAAAPTGQGNSPTPK